MAPYKETFGCSIQRSSTAPFRLQMDSCRCRYLWLFMTILDQTIVNITIPRLQNVFGATLRRAVVLTGYTLVQGVGNSTYAFLAKILGQKRLYLVALAGFTIGSVSVDSR